MVGMCTTNARIRLHPISVPSTRLKMNEWMAMLMGEKKRCHGLRVWLTSLCTTLNKMTEYTNIRYCICYWVKCLFVCDFIFFVICAVMAAASIANIVKSSLGPVGLDKMLVDDIGVSHIFFSVFSCIKKIYKTLIVIIDL